jgi:DNA-binding beta-propeller fold protein YncE
MNGHLSWGSVGSVWLTAAMSLVFSASTAVAQTYDHQQCYKIHDEAKVRVMSDVTPLVLPDFTATGCSIVGRGKIFCVPTIHDVIDYDDRSGLGLGLVEVSVPSQDLGNPSICYKLRCAGPASLHESLLITDPFGIRLVSKFRHHLLCAPALIGIPASSSCGTFLLKWGEPGAGPGEMSAPHGVAVDETTGSVYVADLGNDRIQKYTLNGGYQKSWGSEGTLDGEFDGPHAVAAAQGEVFVVDLGNNRVQVFDEDGTFLRKWGSFGTGNGQFDAPQAIAVGPAGLVFVADTKNHRVQRFSPEGSFQMKWGVEGSADGQFMSPLGIHVTAEGSVLVSDTGNDRIQVFDSDGAHMATWGSAGDGELEFNGPEGISSDTTRCVDGTTECSVATEAVDCAGLVPPFCTKGNIYVADLENSRVKVLESSGNFVAHFGEIGNANGEFHIAPHALAATGDGTIYVVDTGNARVQKFSCYVGAE